MKQEVVVMPAADVDRTKDFRTDRAAMACSVNPSLASSATWLIRVI